MTYDQETEEIKVDPSKRIALKINGLPLATSFAIFPFVERLVCYGDLFLWVRRQMSKQFI